MNHSINFKHLVAAVLIALGGQVQAATAMEEECAQARQFYEDGRWSLAWERFASLADRGDVESAQMVIRMTRFGAQLFQQAWEPAPERMAKWRVVATGQAVSTAAQK